MAVQSALLAELLAPAYLVAMPQLMQGYFQRSVIFLLEHGPAGSMGLVLNKPSKMLMQEFCSRQKLTLRGSRRQATEPIFYGGPVQAERAFMLHDETQRGPETAPVCGGVHLSFSFDSLRLLSAEPPTLWRIYMGYAGWGPGQLAAEIAAGAWLLMQPDVHLLMAPAHPASSTSAVSPAVSPAVPLAFPKDTWELALQQLGIEPMQLLHTTPTSARN